jgi:hypothetical protein
MTLWPEVSTDTGADCSAPSQTVPQPSPGVNYRRANPLTKRYDMSKYIRTDVLLIARHQIHLSARIFRFWHLPRLRRGQ